MCILKVILTHTNINVQTNAHEFGMISYNKYEARELEKASVCICMLKDRETHIFRRVKKVTSTHCLTRLTH